MGEVKPPFLGWKPSRVQTFLKDLRRHVGGAVVGTSSRCAVDKKATGHILPSPFFKLTAALALLSYIQTTRQADTSRLLMEKSA